VLADTQIRKLSVAINQSPATVVISDIEGNIEYVNPQFSIITGYTSEEAIGKNPKILKTDYHDADFYKNMWQTIKSGKTWKGEFYNLRKDGSKYWEDAIIAPILNEKNEIVNYVAIKQDITLRKQAELKVMQQNIQLNELVNTKDKFITILAHDLKNPFNAILGCSELLSENFNEYNKEKIKEFIDMIYITSKNTYNLLKNLLEWAHSQQNRIPYKPEKANLLSITNECYYLVQSNALAKGIKINVLVPKETYVFADKEMIKTVLRNLMTNAIKFTQKNGNIYIKTRAYELKVEVIVSDTGVGMSEKTKNSLFKIGETISENGTEGERGTGFGLMICKEFIDKNGGQIWVDSELGKGSDFKFTLSNYAEL
jgi:PAS domain S-box-containing protein